MKGKPDLEKLKDLARQARSLKLAGQLDYAGFRALLDQAERAAGGNSSLTDILAPYAEPDWIRKLYREEQDARKKKRSVA